jgi:hypothetical protein
MANDKNCKRESQKDIEGKEKIDQSGSGGPRNKSREGKGSKVRSMNGKQKQ